MTFPLLLALACVLLFVLMVSYARDNETLKERIRELEEREGQERQRHIKTANEILNQLFHH